MKRARANVVWQPDGQGWRRVRTRVPGSPRSGRPSERVPRPPSFRFTAAGAEDVSPVSPAASAFGAQLAREVAREVVDRFGAVATVVAVGWLLWKRKAKR